MENKKNIFLIITIVIILLLICTVIFFVIKNNQSSIDDGINDTSIYEEIIVNELEFKIDKITYDGIFSNVSINVKNNSENSYNLGYVKLIFKDKDSNIIGELLSPGVEVIGNNDSLILKTSIDVDLSSATTVEYELIGGNGNEE